MDSKFPPLLPPSNIIISTHALTQTQSTSPPPQTKFITLQLPHQMTPSQARKKCEIEKNCSEKMAVSGGLKSNECEKKKQKKNNVY